MSVAQNSDVAALQAATLALPYTARPGGRGQSAEENKDE